MTTLDVSAVRTRFTGQVVAPGDDGYDGARALFYGGHDPRPAVVIRPADPAEVASVVRLAQETGLELSVRCGGHSPVGHSVVDGGIVLDLTHLRAIAVDVEERTVWAQAGLTAGDVTKAVAEHGLAVGFGDTGTVGIGGITTGGGVGFLSRKYGMTIDNVLAAEVVTADGQILQVDDTHHPDLFWAIRGGGGNFGVVTRFKYQLHEVPGVVGGMILLPATPEVIHGFLREAAAAPEELSVIVNVMPAPPMPFIPADHHGTMVVMGLVCYAGPAEEGEKVLAPIRALAEPIADFVRPITYAEMFMEEGGDDEYHPTATARTMYADELDLGRVTQIVEQLRTAPAPMRVAQFRPLGGAIDRVSADATAYAHRGRAFMVNVASFLDGADTRAEREQWVLDTSAVAENGGPGAYVNFLADDGAARAREAYPGATWERLVRVKQQYDPGNLFRRNVNIPPAN
ncbi:FAD-binding oxidoreductase [Jiangella sp. DSM 45060]|uniref:FAD-binding oxidoreductase n=1 Tax=Jiangella sp. DSM 45060 TaxID=1798224 RepID=UPI00087C1399|nr:FAD-binding oxidoreductase [Jiangella sp. DSM 45060]SDT72244.1 FAD/FMN-containing dehydrogenase [Jiangella sp. DSM 45060]